MTTPESAGPASEAMLWKLHCSAEAALSSSRSTNRGTSASSGGRRTAVKAAISAAQT
jgi:hypothetical protein